MIRDNRTWISTDATFTELELWNALVQSLVKDEQHQCPKGGKANVEDYVKDSNLDCSNKAK